MKGAVKSLMRTDHRQISFFRDIEVHAGAHRYDVRFLHEMFCIAGLPHRNPKTSDGIFRKSGDKFGLTIAPADLTLPGGNTCKIGVPFGAKARLLVVWASSEAKD